MESRNLRDVEGEILEDYSIRIDSYAENMEKINEIDFAFILF